MITKEIGIINYIGNIALFCPLPTFKIVYLIIMKKNYIIRKAVKFKKKHFWEARWWMQESWIIYFNGSAAFIFLIFIRTRTQIMNHSITWHDVALLQVDPLLKLIWSSVLRKNSDNIKKPYYKSNQFTMNQSLWKSLFDTII